MCAFVPFVGYFNEIEEIKRKGECAGNDGEKEVRAPLFQSREKKIYIHSHRYPRAFFSFFGGFPQPPGEVMTSRIYKTYYNSGYRVRAL